ncbi:MAG: hypothetical protein JWR39_2234, partial [Devosia sp.]|nr:hypothetical protein [Devosia sp.]
MFFLECYWNAVLTGGFDPEIMRLILGRCLGFGIREQSFARLCQLHRGPWIRAARAFEQQAKGRFRAASRFQGQPFGSSRSIMRAISAVEVASKVL